MISLSKITVLIVSHDSYKDLWPIFNYFWKINFPDFSGQKIIVTSCQSDLELEEAEYVHLDADWSSRLIYALDAVKTEHVLLLTEDIILKSQVDWKFIDELLSDIFSRRKFEYVRLAPFPPPLPGLPIEKLEKSSLHRVSLQPSIWDVKVLSDLLKPGETAHQFEMMGSDRSKIYEDFYCSQTFLVDYEEVVSRGKFTRKGYKHITKNSHFLKKDRMIQGNIDTVIRELHHLRAKCLWAIRGVIHRLRLKIHGK